MYDFNFAPVFASSDQLLRGAAVTLELSCEAMAIGLVISIGLAAAKTSKIAPLRWVVQAYIELIRNTPFLVQIFFIFFGLPSIGLRMSPDAAALLALVVNFCAYATEIIRAGIESIAVGQIEAGRALGLKPLQVFRYIILKPALRTVYPALTSQFIYLMLTSSVVSVISAGDLTAAGADVQSRTFASMEVYLVITVVYFLMSAGFSALFGAIERAAFRYPLSR
ncbi:amino acid ABC transporter permease [Siculibacillus lacustris]|uniref:Glutamate/aspartate import permease protein GltK n=1 Tax=Siculibacillus lacustris TaxID=1549641 RepID=A0A4Q9VXT8_9HYPH|nr:amino acid ABC transporter permease [Siculibacillus lacustris]TBW41190.1 amino acid ABC transporter permease [Siculibacillus lacustris]